MSYRKIPASRGLFWCVEAWRRLRVAPQPVLSMALWLTLGTFLPVMNFFVVLLLSVFYGGIISALHKIARGEAASLGDFFGGFRSLQQFLGLWLVAVPNILFALFASSILVDALGPDIAQAFAANGQIPSEALVAAALPALVVAAAKLLPVAIFIGWIIFLAVPRVALDRRTGLGALSDALFAVLNNLGALILFALGALAFIVFSSILLAIPLLLIGSEGAFANMLQTFVMVFICTLAWALYLNAMYIAWRDIFMADIAAVILHESFTQIEV